jgi:hypothetical protein
VNDNAEYVLGGWIELIKNLAFEGIDRPDDPWQCPYINKEIVYVLGEKLEGEVGMRVVDDGFFTNLRAIVLSCTHSGDAMDVCEVLAGFH